MSHSLKDKLAASRRRFSVQFRHAVHRDKGTEENEAESAGGENIVHELITSFEQQSMFVASSKKDLMALLVSLEKIHAQEKKLSKHMVEGSTRLCLDQVETDVQYPFIGLNTILEALGNATKEDLKRIDVLVEEYKLVQKLIADHKNLALDLEHYQHKVDKLRGGSGGGDKLQQNEAKLNQAKLTVEAATAVLTQRLYDVLNTAPETLSVSLGEYFATETQALFSTGSNLMRFALAPPEWLAVAKEKSPLVAEVLTVAAKHDAEGKVQGAVGNASSKDVNVVRAQLASLQLEKQRMEASHSATAQELQRLQENQRREGGGDRGSGAADGEVASLRERAEAAERRAHAAELQVGALQQRLAQQPAVVAQIPAAGGFPPVDVEAMAAARVERVQAEAQERLAQVHAQAAALERECGKLRQAVDIAQKDRIDAQHDCAKATAELNQLRAELARYKDAHHAKPQQPQAMGTAMNAGAQHAQTTFQSSLHTSPQPPFSSPPAQPVPPQPSADPFGANPFGSDPFPQSFDAQPFPYDSAFVARKGSAPAAPPSHSASSHGFSTPDPFAALSPDPFNMPSDPNNPFLAQAPAGQPQQTVPGSGSALGSSNAPASVWAFGSTQPASGASFDSLNPFGPGFAQ